MARIVLGAEAPSLDLEVQLGEGDDARVFNVRPVVRSVVKAIIACEEKIAAATDDDELIASISELVDVLTVPQDGQRMKAGVVLREMYEADRLTIPQIRAMADDIAEAANARPT